jgi:PAS domain S-box-containing protein
MTLKTRVVLLVVAMLLAGIWGLAFSFALALERDLTQLLSANFSAVAFNVASDLDRDLRLHTDVLTRLAASLTPEILADAAVLDRALDQFADTSAVVPDDCFVVNGKGIITAGYPEQVVRVGASVADSGYFREVIAGGKPVIGAPIPAGAVQLRSAIPIAVPLRDAGGATVGALVGSVPLSDPLLFGSFEQNKVGQSGWFIVVSPQDRLIVAATDRSRVMTRLPPHGAIPLLDRRLEQGYEGPGITVASIGTEVLTVSRKVATTGWVVIAVDPIEEAFAPIVSLKHLVYLAALLISIAVAFILRFFLARQFAPLAQAAEAMRRMTNGEIPMAAIPVKRQDEIGELISSFNQLVTERSRLEQSLQTEIKLREQAHDALREGSDRLERIYHSVGDGIICIDAEQRIVLFNAAAERIFGYAAADMIGQPLDLLLPQRFRAQHDHHVRAFGSTGQSVRSMGKYALVHGLRAGGEEFPVEATVSTSGSSQNKLFTVVLRDITERRQAEQVREQLTRQLELLSARLAMAQEDERGKLAYELHEELAQELMTLKLYLQKLGPQAGGKDADNSKKEALAVAMHATKRVRKLVLDLEPPELTQFGLYSAARTYSEGQAAAGGWLLHIDAPKPDVRAPRAVERACFRLLQEGLSNVLQHAQAREVWVQVEQGVDALELRIRDDGIGFAYNDVIDINSGDGGSLGLFGMQIRAKHAGGKVEIKSEPGAGTEVRAVFPLPVASVETG